MKLSKICKDCKIEKDISEFYKKGENNTQTRCKLCECEFKKQFHKSNPDKIRSYKRKQNYNLDNHEYERMLKEQNGVCLICKTNNFFKNRGFLCVDHNHNTGIIRGLLCANCNSGLGSFFDDIEIMENAIKYLIKNGY